MAFSSYIYMGFFYQVWLHIWKDDKELKEKVDKALNDMMKDGTFKKIEDKWFK